MKRKKKTISQNKRPKNLFTFGEFKMELKVFLWPETFVGTKGTQREGRDCSVFLISYIIARIYVPATINQTSPLYSPCREHYNKKTTLQFLIKWIKPFQQQQEKDYKKHRCTKTLVLGILQKKYSSINIVNNNE